MNTTIKTTIKTAEQNQAEIDADPELIAVLDKLSAARAALAATSRGYWQDRAALKNRVKDLEKYAVELGWIKPATPKREKLGRVNMRG